MYRLAAQGLPPGAFTAVLFLCGCEDSEDVGDFEVQIDKWMELGMLHYRKNDFRQWTKNHGLK